MASVIRTTRQIGQTIRRLRRQRNMTQLELGRRMNARQATISKLEAGEPATQLKILTDALAALDLELVILPRREASPSEVEDLF